MQKRTDYEEHINYIKYSACNYKNCWRNFFLKLFVEMVSICAPFPVFIGKDTKTAGILWGGSAEEIFN